MVYIALVYLDVYPGKEFKSCVSVYKVGDVMIIRNLILLLVSFTTAACSANTSGITPLPNNNTTATQEIIGDSDPTVGEPTMIPTEPLVIPNTAATAELAPLDCPDPAIQTPALTEGPYYTPGSPEKTSLADDLPGIRLLLTGYVLDTNCNPVPDAWIDFWQADSQGQYDNQGFNLRGHQYTEDNGSYHLETVVPGLYPGRTEHIHVKVQAPGGPVLTTQLFFPDVSQNESDRIYHSNLLIKILSTTPDEIQGVYSFIIATD